MLVYIALYLTTQSRLFPFSYPGPPTSKQSWLPCANDVLQSEHPASVCQILRAAKPVLRRPERARWRWQSLAHISRVGIRVSFFQARSFIVENPLIYQRLTPRNRRRRCRRFRPRPCPRQQPPSAGLADGMSVVVVVFSLEPAKWLVVVKIGSCAASAELATATMATATMATTTRRE